MSLLLATNAYAIQWPWEYENYEECVYDKYTECGDGKACGSVVTQYCDKEFPLTVIETRNITSVIEDYIDDEGKFTIGTTRGKSQIKICITQQDVGYDNSCKTFSNFGRESKREVLNKNWPRIEDGMNYYWSVFVLILERRPK